MRLVRLVQVRLPRSMRDLVHRFLKASSSRLQSNAWLRHHTADISGDVLSIGSGTDDDGEGSQFLKYFETCSSYTTSEMPGGPQCDLVLDVRSMPQLEDSVFDAVYCSGVLEHIDDYQSALTEITRILKRGGIILLGLPFRQPVHMAPTDYWLFTEYGIKYMLQGDYKIIEIAAMDNSVPGFPAAYWVKARKR